jgi:hypothetical protein
MGNKDQKAGDNQQVEFDTSDAKGLDVEFHEKILRELKSVNVALIPDPTGTIKQTFPTVRDPETHKQMWETRLFKAIKVPPDQVLMYMGSPITDLNTSHSASVIINGRHTVVVFDRTYEHGGRRWPQCAWVPDKSVRAGILYGKKIDRKTHNPIAVMKNIGNGPQYQIIGGKEADYRDLKRIFERVFIKGDSPFGEDEAMSAFAHAAITAIESEMEVV